MTTLSTSHHKAQEAYQRAIAENPLPRTAEEQQFVWACEDAMLTASAAFRAEKRAEYWRLRDEGALKTKKMFSHVLNQGEI